jgi:hypothetical protein
MREQQLGVQPRIRTAKTLRRRGKKRANVHGARGGGGAADGMSTTALRGSARQ